jgi:formylglycine-generating enzyme required for sulfatase activity
MRLEQGKMLGDWVLLKHMGKGPLGHVFVAEQKFTKKKAVLKILPEELSTDRGFISRFEDEVVELASLDHPQIAKTYNVSFVDGFYFLATECVVDANLETRNLAEYFCGRRPTIQEIYTTAERVASALDYAHNFRGGQSKGVAHGNLKLNNIMVADAEGEGPVVKVADFGLMKVVGGANVLLRSYKAMIEQLAVKEPFFAAKVGQDKYPISNLDSKQNESLIASLAQNLHFLSPEQRRGDWSNPILADIWAYGVLLFWMLTGSFPEGAWELDAKASSLDMDLGSLIKACLALDPLKRPAQLLPFFTTPKEASSQPVEKAEKSEKLIKEYSPEKRDPRGIVPLLTDAVLIPEGSYYRGSNQGCRDEIPRHAIRINKFLVDIHPVTNEQFVRFLDFLGDEKDHQNHDIIRLKDSRIKRTAGKFSIERGYSKHPVAGVTWYGAMAYASWIGKRLPTEAEWEVACCGGLENPTYPTGEDIEKTEANFFSSDTTPVMSYPPNGYGLYDMAGNVYEWCLDWYEYNYYEYSAQEPDFPKGPIQGVYRVLRGGCWKSLKEDLRCSKRHRNNPGAANGTYGFRCAQDVCSL